MGMRSPGTSAVHEATTTYRDSADPGPASPAGASAPAGPSPATPLTRHQVVLTAVVASVITVLTLPPLGAVPGADIDASWMAALHLAAHRRLHFGSSVIFTYGPLGFLTLPIPYFAWTWAMSAAYVVTLRLALCTGLLSVLRRRLGWGWSAAATAVAVSVTRYLGAAEVALVLFVAGCILLLRRRNPAPDGLDRFAVLFGGAMAGMHLLVKFNTGLFMLALGVITFWVVGRGWRSEATFAAAALAALLGGWVATGNRLSDLAVYLRYSSEVASGYSEAMSVEEASRRWEYLLAAVVILVIAGLAQRGRAALPSRRRMATGLVVATWLFVALKHGFVRHDIHSVLFFGEACLVGLFLDRPTATRRETAGFLTLLVVSVASMHVAGTLELSGVRPDPAGTVHELSRLLRPGGLSADKADGQRQLRESYALTEETLRDLAGHTVHIHPWDAAVAWAYSEIAWKPLPIFQSYSAYTSALDAVNADFLSGPDAPERILATPRRLDGRQPDWDSPAAVRAMACHYVEISSQYEWQLLGRVPNRCGAEQPLGTVRAASGQVVQVPDLGAGVESMIVARVHGLDDSPLYRFRSQLLKTPLVVAQVDGRRAWRLVPGTAKDGLVLSAPRSAVGWTRPLAFPTSVATLQIFTDGWGLGSTVEIEFTAIPVSPAAIAS